MWRCQHVASGANKLPCLDRLEWEDLHEIMLVGDRYGATVVTAAVDRLHFTP
jgi:hypothetical protein